MALTERGSRFFPSCSANTDRMDTDSDQHAVICNNILKMASDTRITEANPPSIFHRNYTFVQVLAEG